MGCQSLLLLHHGGRNVSINQQRENQSFVECLWELHRRVRALLARLRVCACMSVLLARGGSLSHFALARKAIKTGAREQWLNQLDSTSNVDRAAANTSDAGDDSQPRAQSSLAS